MNIPKIIEKFNLKNKLIYILKEIIEKLDSSYQKDKNEIFEDLTPSDNIEDKTYSEALKWALGNRKRIKNIAITGPFGSGKSSFLKTFEKNNPNWKYLFISLATFSSFESIKEKPESPDESKNIDIKDENRLIELSILQQIFYGEKHKNLKDSRFKKIKKLSLRKLIINSLLLTLWFSSIIVLFEPTFIAECTWWQILNYRNESNWILIFSFLILIIGLLHFFNIFQRIFNKFKLSRFNILSGEIELNKGVDPSILNKYLDEILYFFEANKYDVVVFEDLDRFMNDEIFTKLREINALINKSKQINRDVTFIYAIIDDMFVKNNRTKFFDFIIPVIPVINSSNSGEILLKKMKDKHLGINISSQFIEDVSLYIDDMRILKNIRNEFIIYKRKLNPLPVNQDKLLAIIIYKNIYADDFAKLHVNRGMVYKAFQNKSMLKQKIIKDKNERLNELKNTLNAIKAINLKDVRELRSLYIQAFLELFPNAASIRIDNGDISFKELKEDNYFNKFRKLNEIFLNIPNRGWNRSGKKFSDIENIVDPISSYSQREMLLKLKEQKSVNDIKNEIEKIEKEIREISYWTLQRVIEEKGIEYVFTTDDVIKQNISNEKLLIFLLRNGYINEDYHSLISYFYPGSLTQRDKQFALSITDQQPLEFNFELDNIEKLLKKINILEFQKPAVLNIQLIDFILDNTNRYSPEIDYLFDQLNNEKSNSLDFIDAYITTGKKLEEFVLKLCDKWPEIWNFISQNTDFSQSKKDHYLILIIKYSDIENIELIDSKQLLSKYISEKKEFISLCKDEKYFSRIFEIIERLDIHFKVIVNPEENPKLFSFIYENNYYEINEHMIAAILKIKAAQKSYELSDLNRSNYTVIINSKCNNLIEYIHENINYYLTNVFFALETNTHESEGAIISLLNNEIINIEEKERIIEKENTKITDIMEINEVKLWDFIFHNEKIESTWNNVLTYHLNFKKINEILSEFLYPSKNFKSLANKIDEYFDFDAEFRTNFNRDFHSHPKV
jgi:hypothetical protein